MGQEVEIAKGRKFEKDPARLILPLLLGASKTPTGATCVLRPKMKVMTFTIDWMDTCEPMDTSEPVDFMSIDRGEFKAIK